MGEGLRRQGRVLLNALFPRCCEGCGEELGAEDPELCWSCLADLPRIQAPFCSVCGHPVEGRVDHGYVCSVCTRQERDFVMARSALHYRGMSQDLVLAFKYRQAIWLRRFFFDCLDACAGAYFQGEPVSAVVGVPLHPARFRGRGFNQADILAGHLAGRWGWGLLPKGTLRRVRQTPTQTRLTARQRISNVRGSFRVERPQAVANLDVLLVDDVMTTGATVNECARVLRRAGARSVRVLTVARGGHL